MAEKLPVEENLAILEVEENKSDKRHTETYRKHKRKISPRNEDDIPTKIVKKENDLDDSTENETSDTKKSERQTNRPESTSTNSVTSLKRPTCDQDRSFEACKKFKTDDDDLRPGDGKKKHIRRRMKHLLQVVVDQMEFYFSDGNLSKDRYLRKVIDTSPDGYVDLTVFGNFNKLQSLHKDGVSLKVLAAAIRKSEMLELNDDGSKVRRITPIKEINQEETDSKTVYVEQLPAHASHVWIRSIFSQCGKVVYVSLPVYKTTRMIKGFAFVEFETPEEAAKACQLLNNPVKSDEKLGKFPKGNKTLNRLQKLAPVKIDPDSNEENISDDQKADSSQNKTANTNKKKKKTKKRKKLIDSTLDENNLKLTVSETEPTVEGKKKEQTEGKKKKKKKKKKQNQLVDVTASKEGEKIMGTEVEMHNLTDTAKGDIEVSDVRIESSADGNIRHEQKEPANESSTKKKDNSYEKDKLPSVKAVEEVSSKKKKKKKRKGEKKQVDKSKGKLEDDSLQQIKCGKEAKEGDADGSTSNTEVKLSRKERKRLRQEDIRRKKLAREGMVTEQDTVPTDAAVHDSSMCSSVIDDAASSMETVPGEQDMLVSKVTGSMLESEVTGSIPVSKVTDSNMDSKFGRRNDGSELTSILKSKKGQERKKVEFDPVTVTNEFIRAREVRKRKKPKKEKLHLRVIAKKEWQALKTEYLAKQKSHMAALKESLRELRLQENQGQLQSNKHVDLEDVFGTKRLKPSQDLKMAHVESLKFTPNVIVQWKCSHDMPRDKIRTMFKELSGDSIAYIDAKEEAKFGYIRFKDEASAEEFAKFSRRSESFMARILPADQQVEYWKKANEDRVKKLGRKKHEKGTEKIARKVFERNKATFFQKPSHIVFNDEEDTANDNKEKDQDMSESKSKCEESAIQGADDDSTVLDT